MEVDPGAALEAQRKVQRVAHLATHLPEATQKQRRSDSKTLEICRHMSIYCTSHSFCSFSIFFLSCVVFPEY
jgi:hypothetical protein